MRRVLLPAYVQWVAVMLAATYLLMYVSAGAGALPVLTLIILVLTASVVTALIPALLVHEGAHALAGALLGARPALVRIGRGRPVVRTRRLEIALSALNSWTVFERPARSPGRVRLIALAGPVANLVTAVLAVRLAGGFDVATLLTGFSADSLLLVFAISNGAVVVSELIPATQVSGHSDLRVITSAAACRDAARATHGTSPLITHPAADKLLLPTSRPARMDRRWDQVHRLFAMGEFRLALDAAQAPVWGGTAAAEAWLDNLAAMAALELGDPALRPAADAASARAFETLPDESAVRHTRGWLLIETGRAAEGMPLVTAALEDDGLTDVDCAEVLATAALGEFRLDNHDQARGYVRAARELDPGCRLANRVDALLAAG